MKAPICICYLRLITAIGMFVDRDDCETEISSFNDKMAGGRK